MMSPFKKSLKRQFKKEFEFIKFNTEEDNVDLEKHFENRIHFRENINMFNYGTIEHIAQLDSKTHIRMEKKLPINDVSDLTIESVEKIKKLEDEKIGLFITHKNTDAIFVKLFDKPKKDSWGESEIKQLLYSEGITADSLEDMVGKNIELNISEPSDSSYNNKLNKIYNNVTNEFNDGKVGLIAICLALLTSYIIINSMIAFLLLSIPFILYSIILYSSLYNFKIYGDNNE